VKIASGCDGGNLNGNEPEPQGDVRTANGTNSYRYCFLKQFTVASDPSDDFNLQYGGINRSVWVVFDYP
jgi:hypothetical protein